ncbi:hypothetical protein [Sedimentibacter sp.]|uniref:hypothetical protein n=1 Tax=Sedimentibacter sp. TaxID=1960295 RepID=UPI0028AD297D|nr:hypothetical protein [Sedimentibacter sp.]
MDKFFINDEVKAFRWMNNMVINVEGAIIEEISHDNRSSFVTISYGVLGDFGMINIELVTLVTDRNTIIRNRRGRRISVRDLRPGNVVDASFSAAMTRSIPPQARAFMITVVRENVNSLPVFPNIVEDRILEIDTNNNFLITGNPDDIMSQMRFVVNDMTEIYDRRGNRIHLRDLRPGQMVRVEHADFMTASIPPQTTAFVIWVL